MSACVVPHVPITLLLDMLGYGGSKSDTGPSGYISLYKRLQLFFTNPFPLKAFLVTTCAHSGKRELSTCKVLEVTAHILTEVPEKHMLMVSVTA